MIDGFDDKYAVSNCGRVKIVRHLKHSHKPPGTILNPTPHHQNHYLSVPLITRGEKPKRINIQRLVLFAFVGPCPDGLEARHLDGNPHNNHLRNLAWGTPVQNGQDKIKHGTSGVGIKNTQAKLDDSKIIEIRNLCTQLPQHKIAKLFGICQMTVSMISRRLTWRHVAWLRKARIIHRSFAIMEDCSSRTEGMIGRTGEQIFSWPN